MKEKIKRKIKALGLCAVVVLVACLGVSKTVSVTNTVNGKELATVEELHQKST